MRKRIGVKWKEFKLKPFLKSFVKKHRRAIIWVFIIMIIIGLLIPPATYLYFAKDLKDKRSVINRGKTGLTLQTRDGETFFTFYQPKEIKYIPISEIPDSTQKAVIATEDKNFYTNPGFSIRGIGRAFIVNIFAGKIVEGGSTITQELAKNAFLTSRRNFLRKYQEIVLAAELNRRFSKEDILEMYLNSVYFGEGAFGIENASLAYFGKSAKELNLNESALLVGLLPAPSAYSPISNDDAKALRRQNIVLSEMVEEEYITPSEKKAALSKELKYDPATMEDSNILAPHFAIYVKNELVKKYGEERIIKEGFQVRTTLDRTQQEYSERVVKNQIANLKFNDAGNGAVVALDPKTSEILVMVGSYDWMDEKYGKTNMSISPRQPGSSFKPLIYSEAIENKTITAATILDDSPKTFEGNYKPLNYDKRFRGPVTVRRALANSLNIPAVEVMEKVGVQSGLDHAKKLGITTLNRDASNYGLSLVLGAGEVKLIDLTNSYAVFANKGVRNTPKYFIDIKDKYGESIDQKNWFTALFGDLQSSGDRQKAISEEASYIISNILSDNKSRAETFGGSLTVSRPAAVKTGTTNDYRDALTVGYTPNLVVGVWVGNNDNTPMDNIAGSLGAAPIWRLIMNNFFINLPDEQFKKPTFVVSQMACVNSRQTYMEFFISGTQPSDTCELPSPSISLSPSPSVSPTAAPSDAPTPTPTPTPVPESTPEPTTPAITIPPIQITGP
ncbi:MAG TPA: PBP1A family penicillin-binding protein [Candidatus Limnocylindrales bacterium]|nr:PBP1A family penicillin-binding protein [Candidatus Limnocylindrales bacterium]